MFYQDLGEIPSDHVQSLMKNRIEWQSESVENWLRHNFEDFKSEKIQKNKNMDQSEYFSENDTSKSHLPVREKQLGDHLFSQRNRSFTFFLAAGDKKQVSIVENVEHENQNAKRKREKFKRQDTPLHPYSVR